MRRRTAQLAGAVLTLALLVACQPVKPPGQPAPPAPNPSGTPALSKQVLLNNLSQPWDLAFTPNDSTLIFSEKPGSVSALLGGAKRTLGPVAGVVNASEGGLLGLAIHPAYGSGTGQDFIYVCFDTSTDVRVDRLTVNLAYPANSALSAQTNVVTGMPRTTGRHSGCRVRFGPDGMLWITAGDAATGVVPVDINTASSTAPAATTR
jgi:glucose/arabinose dehydrogenase